MSTNTELVSRLQDYAAELRSNQGQAMTVYSVDVELVERAAAALSAPREPAREQEALEFWAPTYKDAEFFRLRLEEAQRKIRPFADKLGNLVLDENLIGHEIEEAFDTFLPQLFDVLLKHGFVSPCDCEEEAPHSPTGGRVAVVGRCGACRFWRGLPQSTEKEMLIGFDADAYYAGMEYDACFLKGYEVRYCEHPRIVFYSRPDRDAAALIDGSQYFARLATAQEFGCTLFEAL